MSSCRRSCFRADFGQYDQLYEAIEALRPLAAWADNPKAKPTEADCERARAVITKADGGQ